METKLEHELGLLLKVQKVNYTGVYLTGKQVYTRLMVDVRMLGKDYGIDWNKVPIEIKII